MCFAATFKVIEGNVTDSVGYRTLAVNGRYIRGFITPNYAKFCKSATGTTTSKPATSTTTTKPSTSTTITPSSSGTLNMSCKFKGVTTSGLNVRTWAGTVGTTVLRVLAKGAAVEVCDVIQDKDGDDWYYVKESGKYGFCSANYIVKESAVTESASNQTTTSSSGKINTTTKFKGTVTASELNVRNWAGTEYGILRALKRGTKVEVCDEIKATTGRVWYYIKESGKYGFVSSEYVARS